MADMNWKRFEREVARKLGGRRLPCDGSKDGIDVDVGPFKVQCKLGRRKPGYLTEWIDGIAETAKRKGAIGVVIWKQPGERVDDSIVLMKLKDFQHVKEFLV